MGRKPVLLWLMVCLTSGAFGQDTFQEAVEKAFGSDQQLVNGIQYSNHYGRIEGHPYLLDGLFHDGSMLIYGRLYNGVRMRYNLFTQRPEVEYQTVDGYPNQFMAVPERIDWFRVGGTQFWRMQPGNGSPGYYQVIPLGEDTCYVLWMKHLGSSTSSSSGYRFNPVEVICLLQLKQFSLEFHNRKTLIKSFPEEKRRTLKRAIKEHNYPFREPVPAQYENFARKIIQIYREETVP